MDDPDYSSSFQLWTHDCADRTFYVAIAIGQAEKSIVYKI